MLIMMKLNSPREDVEKVKEKIISKKCTPHEIPGDSKLAIGITGPSADLVEEDFLLMESVEDVVRVSKQYKLVSREMKPDDTIIAIGEEKIGGGELTIIAGPCSVESREQLFDIAGELRFVVLTHVVVFARAVVAVAVGRLSFSIDAVDDDSHRSDTKVSQDLSGAFDRSTTVLANSHGQQHAIDERCDDGRISDRG